ncbi:Uncharacterized protein Adt_34131 [Abeliophyllum distichum]|uniref:Uncharacterized protein n=1 Tax=Abeliophyllum distichum TaxID=126358 RepID=A0ABD1QYA2_9LAMI
MARPAAASGAEEAQKQIAEWALASKIYSISSISMLLCHGYSRISILKCEVNEEGEGQGGRAWLLQPNCRRPFSRELTSIRNLIDNFSLLIKIVRHLSVQRMLQ